MCVHGRRRCLPDLPILTIFDALPLYKLLETGRICPRLAQLQAKALANRKMLTIFIGENVNREKLYESKLFFEPHLDKHTTREVEKEMAEHSALEVQTLDDEMVNWLKRTFPRVTNLRLILEDDNELADVNDNVIQLLEHWAEKLVSFGIWTGYQFYKAMYLNPVQSLLDVINEKLHSLQYLIISVPLIVHESFFNLNLSFLGQLKLFSTTINPILLLESLKTYTSSVENLPEIRFFEKPLREPGSNVQAKLLELPPRLAAKITALYMSIDNFLTQAEEGTNQLKAFFTRFSALKWYKQDLIIHTFSNVCHLLIALSQLSHLACLELPNVPFYSLSQQDLLPFYSLETLCISGNIGESQFREHRQQLGRLVPALKCIDLKLTVGPVRNSSNSPTLPETVSSLMLHFAQLGLKGSISVDHKFSFSKYMEEFNFADGGRIENWHYDEGKVTIQERPVYYHDFDDYADLVYDDY